MSFQQQNSQKKIRTEYLESETESEFHYQWGSQKSEPKIGIPNLAPSAPVMFSNTIKPPITVTMCLSPPIVAMPILFTSYIGQA